MSALPEFIQNRRDNTVWKDLTTNKNKWLERKIRSLLKGESLATRYVYGYLRYVDKDNRGFAYPAQSTIAKAVKVSPRHVIRCLARLEELDLIIRGKKAGHSYYIFTLPSSLKDSKSALESNLEAIMQEVKELKEKALNFHLEKEKLKEKVTRPCHTNRIKINNKIKTPAPQKQINPSPRVEVKEASSVSKNQDWFSWIESKKIIKLTKEEQEALNNKEKEILSKREKRFKNFPKSFKEAYLKELALAWVLKAYREIKYTREDCFLSKNKQFL